MLKLETAEKLKEAGLEWEPQTGDFCYDTKNSRVALITEEDAEFYQSIKGTQADELVYFIQNTIWLPRLDQLLAEIEKRGCTWALYAPNNDGKYGIDIGEGSLCRNNITAMDNSPEEAAAAALIWILEQGGKPNEL